MKTNGDRIREYRPGDESAIVALFGEIFGVKRTLERWRWQFMDHVQGAGWITLAEVDGEVAAQYCMMRNHLSFMGREICAGQSCDTMVRADQRRKHWFVRLAETNYAYAAGTGMKAVFGFPNRLSYPGLMRRLGWRHIATLHRYTYRIGYRRVWGGAVDRLFKMFLGAVLSAKTRRLGRPPGDVRMETVKRLPDDLESLCAEILEFEVISVWKDLKYLRWRYETHPDNEYEFHILRIDGRPECIIVTRDTGPKIAVCDLLSPAKNVRQASALLAYIMRRYHGSQAQVLRFFGHDGGFFDSVFTECGFSIRYSSDFILGGRVFADDLEEKFAVPQNWTVAYGDTDIL